MTESHHRKILVRDSTLREGQDTPGVEFSTDQKLAVVRQLEETGVQEVEIVAPARVPEGVAFAEHLRVLGAEIRLSGLVYSHHTSCRRDIEAATAVLDHLDLLMPVSFERRPYDRDEKITLLLEALDSAKGFGGSLGVGFPHATQTDRDFLMEIATAADGRGVRRITVYDTNGHADPFGVYGLIKALKESINTPILFHGHNDLGLATANSLAACQAGASAVDVTVNGLGDRAGNASLEQVALALHLKGYETGILLEGLKQLSVVVAKESGVPVSKLAPVVGDFVFIHKSPAHEEAPKLFEAYEPRLVGAKRSLDVPRKRSGRRNPCATHNRDE